MSDAGQSSRSRYRAYRARPKGEVPASDDTAAPSFKRSRSFASLLRQFWKLIEGGHGLVFASLATLTAATLIGLAMPFSTKITIDYILTDNPGPSGLPDWLPGSRERAPLLVMLSGALLAATALSNALGMWGRWQMTRLTKLTQVNLRRKAFEHAVRLPLHRVQQLKSGGAATLVREDAGGAGELVFSLLYNPFRAIVQLVGTLVILSTVDWRLLVGAMALLPAVWGTHQTWIGRIRPVYRDIRITRQGIDGSTTETFAGMRIVRGFGRQRGEASRFVNRNHYMARQEILAWWRSRAVDIVWQTLIPLASIGVLLYGGLQVIHDRLTTGDLMMFTAYLLTLLGPLETLAATATSVQTNLAGLDRVLDLFKEEREFAGDAAGAEPISPKDVRGRITFDQVWFRYPGAERDVLMDIDLDIQPGEVVALVGASGSGKTTLCNLAARFFDPSRGRVLLDGRDLRGIAVDSFRALLGIVEQDVFLFDGTIEDNIRYARPGASRAQVEAAARAANAEEFIRALDKGFATVVGERGFRLSGGQKQRIAIARALLADPRILILDEATSNLDSESEALIRRALSDLMRGRTCFVIAHRLSTIRHADRIVVLEQGRIVEVGRHDELLARGGRYAHLLHLQTEGDAEADWASDGSGLASA